MKTAKKRFNHTPKNILIGKMDSIPGVMEVPVLGKKMEVTFNYLKHTSTHPVRRWTINNLYKTMIKELGKIKASSVLDVGCGEGFTLDRLSKNNIGTDLVGIDFSPVAINLGRVLFPKYQLEVGDIYHLSFKNNSKDLVVCTEVLEHLEHPREALKELVRVSKKYLLLSVPHEPIFCLKNLLIGRNIKRLGSSKGHLNLWTSWGFRNFVKRENLKILSFKHPFPFTLVLAQKCVPHRQV